MNDPILSRLGMARRAGLVSPGFECAKNSLKCGVAKLVLVASDVSAKTEKEIRFFSGGKIPVVRIDKTIFEVTNAIGTKAGVVSVNDDGFAKAILKNLPEEQS
ncbi:MAG: 50S ribosomal protein L7ae [Oscillospiraceae bacterium]|nr:50S ribosomal protein L7ae [Oscillospiraceae bacterium]